MYCSFIAARFAPLVVALAAAPTIAQVNAHRQGAEPRSSAISIEKVNTRPTSRLNSSIKEYEGMLAASPDDAILLNNLGVSYFLAARYYEAQSMMRKAHQRAPASLPIRVNLSIALNKTHNPALAIGMLEGIMAEDPRYGRARQILCELYAQEERVADAKECYGLLYRSGQMDVVRASGYANLLLVDGQIGRALEVLRWADSTFPEDAAVKNALGVVMYRKEKYKAAKAYLERAVALDPQTPQTRFNLAMTQLADNNRGAVLEQYKYLKTASPELAGQLYEFLFRDKIIRVKPRTTN